MKAAFQSPRKQRRRQLDVLAPQDLGFFLKYWPRIRTSLSFALILVCMYVVSDLGLLLYSTVALTWELYKAREAATRLSLDSG